MALPALNERLAIYKSRAAIPEGKQVKVKGISVTGTGHPFYVFQPSSGQALITLHPRKPVGLPLGGMVKNASKSMPFRLTSVEPRSSQYAGDAAKDENLLAGVLKLKTSYANALEVCLFFGIFFLGQG